MRAKNSMPYIILIWLVWFIFVAIYIQQMPIANKIFFHEPTMPDVNNGAVTTERKSKTITICGDESIFTAYLRNNVGEQWPTSTNHSARQFTDWLKKRSLESLDIRWRLDSQPHLNYALDPLPFSVQRYQPLIPYRLYLETRPSSRGGGENCPNGLPMFANYKVYNN